MNNQENEFPHSETEPQPAPDEPAIAEDAIEAASAEVDHFVPTVVETADEDFPALEIQDATLDDVPEDEPFAVTAYAETEDDFTLMGEDVDIDAALAAVANLSDAAAAREMIDSAPHSPPSASLEFTTLLPMPPAVALKRGTLASLIPAVLLIVSGAVLTFMTTSGAQISTEVLAFGALAAVALLMLGYWLSARRWAGGTFFFACLLLLSAAAVYAMTQPNGLGERGLPLLVIATGVSLLLTALLTRPMLRRALLPALLLMIAGGVALGFSLGLLDMRLVTPLRQVAWVLPVILAVLWLLPIVFRHRAS